MDTRTVEQVTQWESRPFTGGLSGLRELAEEGFSGAVRAAGTWAFVLNGRVVGVFEGELEDFEGQEGTAYRAPDQALALLFTMQERGGETQAKYYTNDTPLSDVHETLSSGNFSGYVELSENVLSGDYYVVYYGGRSMSAAFVGESERLLTGDEAFDRADDEVGIYEVKKVGIDVIDLSEIVDEPEPEPEPEPEAQSEPEPAEEAEQEPAKEVGSEPEPKTDPEVEPGPSSGSSEVAVDSTETPAQKSEKRPEESTTSATGEPTTSADSSTDDASDSTSGGSGPASARSGSAAEPEGTGSDDVFSEEQQWRQANAIPSLDPERSSDGGQQTKQRPKPASKGSATKKRSVAKRDSSNGGASSTSENSPARDSSKSAPEPKSKPTESKSSKPSKPSKSGAGDDGASIAEFKQALQQSKREIEQLSERLSKTESEQQELLAEREELRSKVERLTSELERAKADDGAAGASGGRSLPVQKALEGTNLFVRYASKSQPTLEDAREGADREEVNTNLSLEHHTQFDADEVVVDGVEFESFLRESIQYRFVEWLVEDLIYEIRDTGHVNQLRELFDAIPKIDRAELYGNATIRKTEDGEEVRTQRTFDVLLRDRMGNPLVVANLNDARDPATGDMMADLVSAANDVGETSPSLSAAVFVTASFFEPAALETAAEATGGGLLSREKKESYVKLTRKRGYHLCLVETRGGQFHVNVPEL